MTDIEETLLLEVNQAIAVAAKDAVERLGRASFLRVVGAGDSQLGRAVRTLQTSPRDLRDISLTSAESEALVGLNLSPEARSGLEKLIADATAAAFFRFFCLMDAVAEPEVEPVDRWQGAVLAQPPEGAEREMLHDEFFESYWRQREANKAEP